MEPPGRFAEVEPRSVSLASAFRVADADELDDPLLGVENRFRAVDRDDPPEPAEPVPDCAAELDEDDEEACADEEESSWPELEEAVELDALLEEPEEEELPAVPGVNVGVLEMAVVVARDAEGRLAWGARRRPRNCGTVSAA